MTKEAMWGAKYHGRMQNAECRMQNAECRMQIKA
jgi:hypothetical protein